MWYWYQHSQGATAHIELWKIDGTGRLTHYWHWDRGNWDERTEAKWDIAMLLRNGYKCIGPATDLSILLYGIPSTVSN